MLLRRKRSEGGTGTQILEFVWTLEEVDCNFKGLSMECFLPPADLKKEEESCEVVTKYSSAKLKSGMLSTCSRFQATKIVPIDYSDDEPESSDSSDHV